MCEEEEEPARRKEDEEEVCVKKVQPTQSQSETAFNKKKYTLLLFLKKCFKSSHIRDSLKHLVIDPPRR